MITETQKIEIQNLLNQFVERKPSQAKAAAALRNVSEATVINIRKGKWDGIKDDMWRNVGAQVGFSNDMTWKIVETKGFNALIELIENAREHSLVLAITAQEGYGKSATSDWFQENTQNTYRLECADYFNKKLFLQELCRTMSLDRSGTVGEIMTTIIRYVRTQDKPVIILDEVDKLPDPSFYFFITLCNQLQDKCGIVVTATDYLQKRMEKGVRLNRKGYKEIYSRMGRNFIKLPDHTFDDVAKICLANGCDDEETIHEIFNQCEGDVRRVKRSVHAYHMAQKKRQLKKSA
jgi:DNA transposition AAA+ family ATPase